MDVIRKLVKGRIEDLGLDMAQVSRQLGKNHAYVQQFIGRSIPRRLPEDVRQTLAEILKIDEHLLKPQAGHISNPLRNIADPETTEEGPMAPKELEIIQIYRDLETADRLLFEMMVEHFGSRSRASGGAARRPFKDHG